MEWGSGIAVSGSGLELILKRTMDRRSLHGKGANPGLTFASRGIYGGWGLLFGWCY